MNDVNRSHPAGREVKDGQEILWFRGQAYVLPPLELSDFDEARRHLLSQRQDPIAAIAERMRQLAEYPQLQAEFLDRAYRDLRKRPSEDTIPDREVKAWLDSEPGFVWTLTRCLSRRYPSISEGFVREMLAEVGMAEIARARDRANQSLVQQAGVGGEPGQADEGEPGS